MNADQKEGWVSLEKARQQFMEWARSNGIAMERVEHVATFEQWDKNTELYLFFSTDAELERIKSKNELSEIENQYRHFLLDLKYPFERWPIALYFDSHENVVKNYEGNYFYRLR
jgi:hypothetical protein